MKPLLRIGITGGIGSGKSLVCKIFRCLDVPVYDADSRAKALMANDPSLVEDLKKAFGKDVYDQQGHLNRRYMAETVFDKPEQLKKLNHLVHPRVKQDFQNWVAQNQDTRYVVKEAALIFEGGPAQDLDRIILVSAPESLRIKRVLQRDPQRTEKEVRSIIGNQMPEAEKLKLADFVIFNDESRLVIPQVLELHKKFLA